MDGNELDEVLGPILDYLTQPRDHGKDGETACGMSCCEPWLKGQNILTEEPLGVAPKPRRRRRKASWKPKPAPSAE